MNSNKVPKKPGRPKSPERLEKEHTEAWLTQLPEHIKPLTKEQKEEINQFLYSPEESRRKILKDHHPLLPHALIYDLESIGHEMLQGFEDQIEDKYYEKLNKILAGPRQGALTTISKADDIAVKVWGRNEQLINRIKKGTLTLNGASETIFIEWDKRGISGHKKPSIKTISNWYKRIHQNSWKRLLESLPL